MKRLTLLLLLATASISQALEGTFWVKEVGRNSVVIAPLVCTAPIDMRGVGVSDMTRVGGGGGFKNEYTQEKKKEPTSYIPWDKTNVNFKVGTMFHATYTVTKKYGYEYFTVSKYTIIEPIKKK
jgi:hypothetical protein